MKAIKKSLGKGTINNLKDKSGQEIKDRDGILRVIKNYYQKMYKSKNDIPKEMKENVKGKVLNVNSEEIPEITEEEIISTLKNMKNNKAPGADEVLVELIRDGDETVI